MPQLARRQRPRKVLFGVRAGIGANAPRKAARINQKRLGTESFNRTFLRQGETKYVRTLRETPAEFGKRSEIDRIGGIGFQKANALSGLTDVINNRSTDSGKRTMLIKEIVKQISAKNPSMTGYAIEALGNVKATEHFPTIVSFLKSPAMQVRFASINALGKLRNRRAIPALKEIARTDPDPRNRKAATEAMASLMRPSKVPVLNLK